MATAGILLVEDENIVALDLRMRLTKLGYSVLGMAASGEEAVAKATSLAPDLVLMDINLKGDMDGIGAAEQIKARLDIPVIFVTAYADENTLQRAKITEPYGYLLKPFEERELHTSIEIALYKHKMERRLKESERWHSTTLNSIGDAVITTDTQGRITFMNPVAEGLTGWPAAEALGQEAAVVFSVIAEETRAATQSPIATVLREGVTAELADGTLLVSRNGREIPIDDSAAPIIDEQGNVSGVVLVFHDITERRRARDQIQRHNRELALLNRIISASVMTPDPTMILEIACRELAVTFNLPQVAVVLLNEKKTLVASVVEHQAENEQSGLGESIRAEGGLIARYLRKQKSPLMVNNIRNDSLLVRMRNRLHQHEIHSLVLLPLIVDGEVIGGLGLGAKEPFYFSSDAVKLAQSAADQIALALRQARLSEVQQRLTTAIEQTAEGMVVTDDRQTILYVNPAFERISGYSRQDLLGQSLLFGSNDPENSAYYQEMWPIVQTAGVWSGRMVNHKKDGTPYTVDTTATAVRQESGEIVSYVILQRDITREIALEEQFHQAQKMEAIGLLAGGIAHDFNNLLTAINGFTELAQSRLETNDPLQSYMSKILHSGNRAANLVSQLLTFSRKQVIQPKILSLNTVVTQTSKMLERIIGEHIPIRASLESDLWPIKADPTQLEQIIVNLAVNARDAMPQGGWLTIKTTNITLSAHDDADHLDVPPGNYVLLAVEDTGVGMSKEVLAHIFEPFYTTKEIGRGTGLGLATVYGIVQQSKGHIRVSSDEGNGTTFKIYLPSQVEAQVHLAEDSQAESWPMGTETILLVEDEPAVREMAACSLRDQNYTVLEASNGQDALHIWQHHGESIQLLLTDLVMPGLNGQMLADTLVQSHPSLKTLFMSGYSDEMAFLNGEIKTSAPFIQKPFSLRLLVHKVREVLDSKSPKPQPNGLNRAIP